MEDPLVRFGLAIDGSLLKDFDALVAERGCTRSELFRSLARAEVVKAKVRRGVDAVGALTIVYEHHVRDLSGFHSNDARGAVQGQNPATLLTPAQG